ncbi:MAG: hypothetical protein HN742_21980 [Lentisphaerae bacterium]|jgi:hypothetical protein|nr:hypothetical protein [Lentisphaerota bacterium]MBT4820523.1 hypothetical protein [Lentisphaerota bacterium]MBT5607329.1 hypothetical protein [Lentisphaerota bacterium]MBT7055353.1 hypothetical protein [Lentisphaerota bacterium]MBT7844563.1 hypothetical protein [Lentisphaerota bacterium]
MEPLVITVQRSDEMPGNVPVTGGVPLPQGAVPTEATFMLQDSAGKPVPLQTEVLGTWDDGSVRWVLLDFQSGPGDAIQTFRLERGVSRAVGGGVAALTGAAGLENDSLRLVVPEEGLLAVPGRFTVHVDLMTADGVTCQAVAESAEVETAGPLRGTLSLRGNFRRPDGERVLQFRIRASVFAGLGLVRLRPMVLIDADKGVLCQVKALNLMVRPNSRATAGTIGGAPDWRPENAPGMRLFQRDDEAFELHGADGRGDKAPGWATMETENGEVTVAMRDFWQQWPKSLAVSADGLEVGILPRFDEGDFAHMEPWYKHQWFFAGDCYQLRAGQARSWELLLNLNGDGDDLARLANCPPVPAADPEQAIATGVWGAIQPAGTPAMDDYDPWADRLFDSYVQSIEMQRDYGALNWGDWFGERRINWGNHEYDTTDQLLLQFARTGDPTYLRWADAAGRHSAEVDTVHHVNADLATYFDQWHHPAYPSRPGLVHEHAHGHVGGFITQLEVQELLREKGVGRHSKGMPYSCLNPFNLGHVWTTGLMRLYFLTGNPFLKETVEIIGDNLARLVEDREYTFMGSTHCGRVAGWTLLALGGAYEISRDERFVKAMRTLAEDALEMQDPVCGGWIVHPMAPDHCICEKARHTGMATFITAVLINGLARYHELSGDERMVRCLDEAVSYINNDTWRDSLRGWRYTSCPAHRTVSQAGVIIMAYVNAVKATGNPEHLRILRLAWEEKFGNLLEHPPEPGPGQGKSYTASVYGCPEAVGLLAE